MNLPKAFEDSKRHYSFLYNNPVLFSFPGFAHTLLNSSKSLPIWENVPTNRKEGNGTCGGLQSLQIQNLLEIWVAKNLLFNKILTEGFNPLVTIATFPGRFCLNLQGMRAKAKTEFHSFFQLPQQRYLHVNIFKFSNGFRFLVTPMRTKLEQWIEIAYGIQIC
jgi:hypothetical protein